MNCRECQSLCLDLLERNLSVSSEQRVMQHVGQCTECSAFLADEGRRMREWPNLLQGSVAGVELPCDAVERISHSLEVSRITPVVPNRFWVVLAASFLAVLGIWFMLKLAADYKVKVDANAARVMAAASRSKPAVELLKFTGTSSPDLPQQLPGYFSLYDGEAKIRLTSGVELTLIAPVSLEFEDSMLVRLNSGKMLAFVPQWARGFTVRTSQLEIWDLGTVFGVSSRSGCEDVMVFEGSVQVNESDGNAVDLCVAGEAVRAERGELPRKIAAEWAEAEQLFASVAGRKALAEPEQTFKAVDDLHEMWLAKYNPKPVEKKQVAKPKPKPAKTISTGQVAQTKAITDKAVVALSESKQEEEMKAVTNMIAATVAAATLGVANVGLSVPQVSNVRLEQITGTRAVKIKYDLDQDAIITLAITTNGVSIGDQHVTRFISTQSGVTPPVNRVVEVGDDHEIIWNAGIDWPEHEEQVQAKVTAWSEDAPPLYCAVNVLAGLGAGVDVYPVYYYPSAEAVPDGVTNIVYKTHRILMRRIDPTGGSGFRMGSPAEESGHNDSREVQVDVMLTKPFYIGIYQVTQKQWNHVMGNWPSYFTTTREARPVEQVSYYDIREAPSNNPIDSTWPESTQVHGESFMGLLRSHTGLNSFDLPTEAQWEWACRAETGGALNDGTTDISNLTACVFLDQLGRYSSNGGSGAVTEDTTAKGTAAVGSYLPNAWGLYDMHGNVYEWCLNWYTDAIGAGENPEGVTTENTPGYYRMKRGGAWNSSAQYCRSATRNNSPRNKREANLGFRVAIHLP